MISFTCSGKPLAEAAKNENVASKEIKYGLRIVIPSRSGANYMDT
jgi:hypothetical protein